MIRAGFFVLQGSLRSWRPDLRAFRQFSLIARRHGERSETTFAANAAWIAWSLALRAMRAAEVDHYAFRMNHVEREFRSRGNHPSLSGFPRDGIFADRVAISWKPYQAGKVSSRLLKNACVDPLVLRDAMLCIAPRNDSINGINAVDLFLRSRWKRRLEGRGRSTAFSAAC
jgi:hypothetical protein